MRRLTDMMSRYVPGNPVEALQREAGRRPVSLPGELFAVLQMAERVSRETEGAFDVTVGALSGWRFDTSDAQVPLLAEIVRERRLVNYRDLVLDPRRATGYLRRPGMRVDLGGIAKLPILQAGMDVLADHGVANAMINGGGDVLVRGTLQGRPWRIGVRDPAQPDRLLAVLPLSEGFVASSGDYERCWIRDGRRYHHVLDPATGYPTEQVHGVSLVATDLREINGLGAAAMVRGPQAGAALLARTLNRQALLVRRDGSLWISPTLAARLVPPPGQDHIRRQA
jgi:thiamine biosynthesis lipoprotein